jgi:signal transduction histidine kinase
MGSPRFKLFVGLVLSGGLLAWLLSWGALPWTVPTLGCLIFLGATSVYAEIRSMYVTGYGMINFGEGIYFAATLRYGGPLAALICGLMGLVADRAKKRPWGIVVFNLGWSLCTFTAVGWAVRSFDSSQGLSLGNSLSLLGGGLVYAMVAALLQAACQTFEADMSFSQTLRRQLKGMRIGAPATMLLGLFGDVLLELSSWSVVLALFPVEIFTAYVRLGQVHEQLLATQGQLQANSRQAALGVLTAGVAHEINNPLAAMATSVHMLERQALPPQSQLCLKLLTQGISRCQSITDRMLLYSRPPENRPSSCTVSEVVQDALLFLATRLGTARVEVAPELAVCPPVACDPGVLVQVLTNLFTNAADALACKDGGLIKVSGGAQGGKVRILVTDNGGGIPANARERIWEPFFTTKDVGSGTGLGLAISLSLVRSAGGDLRLRQTSAQGSQFEVDVPLRFQQG